MLVGIRVDIAEGEIFKLAAQFTHAKAVRKWRVDVEGLARDAGLLVRPQGAQGTHVMQAVGHLDQDDTDVRHHGK